MSYLTTRHTCFLALQLSHRLPPLLVLVNAESCALCFELDLQRCCYTAARGAEALSVRPAHALQQLKAPAQQQCE